MVAESEKCFCIFKSKNQVCTEKWERSKTFLGLGKRGQAPEAMGFELFLSVSQGPNLVVYETLEIIYRADLVKFGQNPRAI